MDSFPGWGNVTKLTFHQLTAYIFKNKFYGTKRTWKHCKQYKYSLLHQQIEYDYQSRRICAFQSTEFFTAFSTFSDHTKDEKRTRKSKDNSNKKYKNGIKGESLFFTLDYDTFATKCVVRAGKYGDTFAPGQMLRNF